MIPLALAGLARGALRLARDPTVRKIVKGGVQGALQGFTSGKGIIPGALQGALSGASQAVRTKSASPLMGYSGARTASSYRKPKAKYKYYHEYEDMYRKVRVA